MTTALFLLRCVQLGIAVEELEMLEVGMVLDMYVELNNDSAEYATVAQQSDFDNF